MKSLPTILEFESYQAQTDNNNVQAEILLKSIFPKLKVPYEQIANILELLEAVELDPLVIPFDVVVRTMAYVQETKVNPEIIPHIIVNIDRIRNTTGKGQVIVHVDQGLTNVQLRTQSPTLDTLK